MTHQVKRLESASFIIINQDASCMPNFKLPNKVRIIKLLLYNWLQALEDKTETRTLSMYLKYAM